MPAESSPLHRRSEALLAGQNEALQLAVAGAPLSAVLAVLVRAAETQSEGGILASILLLEAETGRLRHGAAPSLPPEYNAAIDGIAIGPGVGSCGTAAYLNQVVVVSDIASDPLWADFRDLALAHGLRACWSTPIHSTDGKVLGTFALYYRVPSQPTLQDRGVVNLLANTAAVVIERYRETKERLRIEEAVRRQAAMLARVASAARAIISRLDGEAIAQALADEAQGILGAHQAVVWLALPGGELQAAPVTAWSEKWRQVPVKSVHPAAAGICAHVRATKQPLRLTPEELERHPLGRATEPGSAGRPELRGCLALPLADSEGTTRGVVLLSDKAQGSFTPEDEAVLTQLASTAAVAIEKAALYGFLRESSELTRVATEAGGLGLFTWDVESDQVTWHNDRPYAIFGIAKEEGPLNASRFAAEFLHPDDVRAFADAVSQVGGPNGSFHFRGRITRRLDRQLRWVEFGGVVQSGAGMTRRVVGTAADVTERKLAEDALREREERLRQLANTIPNLAWMAGADGAISWYNDRWYDYTGTTPQAMEGWGWQQVHDPQVLPAVMQAWTTSLRTGEPFEMTFPLRGKDGVFRPFFTRVAPLRDSAGAIVQWFGTNTDVSPLVRAEEELRAADRRKDEFIAMLAHELRNPLAPIRTAAELLKRLTAGDERVRKASEIISRQVGHMSGLLNDLLDVSRISRGLVAFEKEPVRVADVVANAVEQTRAVVASRGHRLVIAAVGTGVRVLGNEVRLTQVVSNLLDNAAKYSDAGGTIALDVACRAGEVTIAVSDGGRGIEEDLLPRLFEPFSQGQRGLDRTQGGLGLGLAVVKGLAELHGGRVSAASEGPGRGSRFEVVLPLLPDDGVPATPDGAADTGPDCPRDVLIVDDNRDAADTLAMLLQTQGHRVAAAYHAREALEMVRQRHFDLALLDIGLPEVSGLELAALIRAASTAPLPLFALSGYGREQDLAATSTAGFARHFVKPVDVQQLLGAMKALPPIPPA